MTTSDGAVLRTVQVVDRGSAGSRFDIVVLSEGYTRAELDNGVFETDVDTLVAGLFAAAPFDDPTVQAAINVWRVDVASTDSGCDDPGLDATGLCLGASDPDQTRTYFDATFCGSQDDLQPTERVHRLLSVNTDTVLTLVGEQVPSWDVAMVLVNTTIRGGSGVGGIPVLSKSTDMVEVMLHELGHAGFGLADEYGWFVGCASGNPLDSGGKQDVYPPRGEVAEEPVEVNVTVESDPAKVKWRELILPTSGPQPVLRNSNCAMCDAGPSPVPAGTVGVFEGARYYHCGLFRPDFNCRMRDSDQPFCAVCQLRIRTTLRLYAPRKKDPMDYTVVIASRTHLGDQANELPGTFVGKQKDFTFDCPSVDPAQTAVMNFQALSVGSELNVFQLNGKPISGDLPKTTNDSGAWSAQTMLLSPNTLKPRGNLLHVEARTTSGSTSGNIDDFVLDNLVVFYKTS